MSDFIANHLQGLAAAISAGIALAGVILASPHLKKILNIFKSKNDLNSAYYALLKQFTEDREAWRETMVSWKGTATALRSEMVVLKERLGRLEAELERLIPKYRSALKFILELKSHIVEKDMPKTPELIEHDLDQIYQEIQPQ